MRRSLPGSWWQLTIEYLFFIGIAAAVFYTAWFFNEYHYLPQPFFYEPSGTFMDWYALAYYGHHSGAYDVEGTIYPPISFVLMKIFGITTCYATNRGEEVRACDWVGSATLVAMYVIDVVLTFWVLWKVDRRTAFPRGFAMCFGFPMLYLLERGNLLLFCYACVLLGYGPLLKSARMRWIFAGAALNFKVYLVGATLAPLLRRRWLQTEGIIVSGAIIYLITWMIMGEGSPLQILRNVTTYAEGFGAGRVLDLWYASSMLPAISFLRGEFFPILTLLGSRTVDNLLFMSVTMLHGTQLVIVLAAVAAWVRPDVVPSTRLVFFAIALATISSEVGGYTETMLLIWVFMERWRGIGRPLAILIAFTLSIPADIILENAQPIVRDSWLGGTYVTAEFGVGIFGIVRPLFVLVMIWCMASVTVHDVWRDIRVQGWRTRWRFRHDAPVMVGAGQAAP